jgi:hypothetical protein
MTNHVGRADVMGLGRRSKRHQRRVNNSDLHQRAQMHSLLAENLAGGDVEGSDQRGRAMAGIVVAAPRRLARLGNIGWLRLSA